MEETFDVGGLALARPFRLQRLGHIGLTQIDPARCNAFYCDDLGFRSTDIAMVPGMAEPVGYFASYGTDHHSLANITAKLAGQMPAYAKGVTANQISFQVGSLKEVADANAFFERDGLINWRYGRDSPGSNWADYTFDPDGFGIELYYGMEQIGWDRRSKPPYLYTAPDYTPQLPAPAEITEVLDAEARVGTPVPGYRPAEPMPFIHEVDGIMLQRPFAINRIGPVHLFVEDIEASTRFYTDKIGMTVTETVTFEGHDARYLRIGTDHHVIALIDLRLREAAGCTPQTRVGPIGIELGSFRQLRNAIAWLRSRGNAVWTDAPRDLRPGIGHAAFLRDPGGHTLMLYCGMEQIGWSGEPCPAAARARVSPDWPDRLTADDNRYSTLTRQGPMA